MEFLCATLVFPLLSIGMGIGLQVFFKKCWLSVGFIFMVWGVLTLLLFGSTFWIWCFFYTFLTLIVTVGVYVKQQQKESL